MVQIAPVDPRSRFWFPTSFRDWRRHVTSTGAPPVVAIAGSRGKTTVLRLLDAILRTAGLRTTLWTDRGVEVDGRRQAGELVPWSRALARVARGDLDLAIQELDWSTVHAIGLPPASYPLAAVTNLCVNSDSCLIQTETRRALRALDQIRRAAGTGTLVLNGEDFAVAGDTAGHGDAALLVGISADAPLMRAHLRAGGSAAWSAGGTLLVGSLAAPEPLAALADVDFALGGAVGFQVHNALTAAALARTVGIDPAIISLVIADFTPSPRQLPGSFNVVHVAETTFVVDRPAPSWFLRTTLRAVPHIPARRSITVVGDLREVPDDDLPEVGRLLGRAGGALVLAADLLSPERAEALRTGIGSNDVPPLIIRTGTERQAMNRAIRLAQPGDLVLALVSEPLPALRALDRAASRGGQPVG